MSITANLRYQKRDEWNNEVFIASERYPDEKEGAVKLKLILSKLGEMDIETFIPIYINDDIGYSTIRFKNFKGLKLVERNLYTVNFSVNKIKRGDKEYINCYINYITLKKKAKPQERGETLEFNI
jgi:hypothetical protein